MSLAPIDTRRAHDLAQRQTDDAMKPKSRKIRHVTMIIRPVACPAAGFPPNLAGLDISDLGLLGQRHFSLCSSLFLAKLHH